MRLLPIVLVIAFSSACASDDRHPPENGVADASGSSDSGGGAGSGGMGGGDVGRAGASGLTGASGMAGSSVGSGGAFSGGSGSSGGTASTGSGGLYDTDMLDAASGELDSGNHGLDGSDITPDAPGAPNGTPTIVAVGYAGLRVASFDLGRSWINKSTLSNTAADDPNNLRGITYGAGLFVAVGHKIFTSTDAEEWTERSHPISGQWLGDVKYGNGRFVAAGGYGYSAWSVDGIEWHQGGSLNTEASRSVAFGNGEFIAQTDPGNWYRSADGETWTLHSGSHDGRVAFCSGTFVKTDECGPAFGHGVYIQDGGWNSGSIQWSENGQGWHSVSVGYTGGINAFAFGYIP